MLIAMLIKIIFELITLASNSVNISVRCLMFFIYYKLKNIFHGIQMNAEELLQDIPKNQQDAAIKQQYKKKISAIVAGGGSKQ